MVMPFIALPVVRAGAIGILHCRLKSLSPFCSCCSQYSTLLLFWLMGSVPLWLTSFCSVQWAICSDTLPVVLQWPCCDEPMVFVVGWLIHIIDVAIDGGDNCCLLFGYLWETFCLFW
jgi:hypothetical protein